MPISFKKQNSKWKSPTAVGNKHLHKIEHIKWLWLLWLWAGIPVIVQLQHAAISRMNQPALIMEHRLSQAAIKVVGFPNSRWWTFWSFWLESWINKKVHISLILSIFLLLRCYRIEMWSHSCLINAFDCTKIISFQSVCACSLKKLGLWLHKVHVHMETFFSLASILQIEWKTKFKKKLRTMENPVTEYIYFSSSSITLQNQAPKK